MDIPSQRQILTGISPPERSRFDHPNQGASPPDRYRVTARNGSDYNTATRNSSDYNATARNSFDYNATTRNGSDYAVEKDCFTSLPKTLHSAPQHRENGGRAGLGSGTQLRRYNRYQDVEIDASLLPHDEIGRFLSSLSEEESKWLSRLGYKLSDHGLRINALFWVKVKVQLSHLLPPLLGTGTFMVHHATQDYIMLVKGPGNFANISNIPLYGTHYTRVECIVIDEPVTRIINVKNEDTKNLDGTNTGYTGLDINVSVPCATRALIVKEMVGSTECSRKLVTGSVESGEYINEAAEREVMEETGIACKFVGMLGMVNRLCTRFNRDEILVGCLLRAHPPGQIPKPSSTEIRSAEWVPLSELQSVAGNYMTKRWCAAHMAIESASPEKHAMGGTEMPDFRGHGHTMMMFSLV